MRVPGGKCVISKGQPQIAYGGEKKCAFVQGQRKEIHSLHQSLEAKASAGLLFCSEQLLQGQRRKFGHAEDAGGTNGGHGIYQR